MVTEPRPGLLHLKINPELVSKFDHREKNQLFATLPSFGEADFDPEILKWRSEKVDCIIVLDDDPTGTQTVHDIPVLTEWSTESLYRELAARVPLFFILTNSRSLHTTAAEALALEIGGNIARAARMAARRILVISRSDSTLRGHYPEEIEALQKGLGQLTQTTFIIPAFFEGGRYTIDDVHWVQEGERLIPAAQTPFARDKVFGYKNSNLRDWIREKSESKIPPERIRSISINELRLLSAKELISKIGTLQSEDVCIVNGAEMYDLKRFCWALFQTQVTPLFRVAASFVAAIACQPPRHYLTPSEIVSRQGRGGLVIVGSYVPKTTSQLNYLLTEDAISAIEIDIINLINEQHVSSRDLALMIDEKLKSGQTVVIYTSRQLVSGQTDEENLSIGRIVSNHLNEIVNEISVWPSYILTKGGITSSDITTKALMARRVIVLGQIMPGVPVWKMDETSRFAGLCQIVFPGNVGDDAALAQVVRTLNFSPA